MDVKELQIDENITIMEAMQQLNSIAKKILFVTRKSKFVATLTDGDIRRWLLKKGSLNSKVSDIANYSPISLMEQNKYYAKELMKQYSIEAIPIIDINQEIVSVILWNDIEVKKNSEFELPVVIMAGGIGSRLYPYTKVLPKPLIPIGEIPIVEHIINRFNNSGANQFFLIVNHKKNMIKAYFNEIENKYELNFIDEDKPLGTGGGLSLVKDTIKSTFILSNCDIIVDEDYEKIYKYHLKEKNLITMVCSLKNIKIPYGIVEVDNIGNIEKLKEKPEFSFFTNTGLYIVEPKVLEEIKENQNIGFPEIIESYINKGEKIGIYPISENNWMDMGQIEEMDKMIKRLEQ